MAHRSKGCGTQRTEERWLEVPNSRDLPHCRNGEHHQAPSTLRMWCSFSAWALCWTPILAHSSLFSLPQPLLHSRPRSRHILRPSQTQRQIGSGRLQTSSGKISLDLYSKYLDTIDRIIWCSRTLSQHPSVCWARCLLKSSESGCLVMECEERPMNGEKRMRGCNCGQD